MVYSNVKALAGLNIRARKSRTLLNTKFDGDKMSYTAVWTDDAREELQGILNSWEYYVAATGGMSFSFSDDVIDITLASMTKRLT